jgi:hypothetical protein
MGAWASSPAIPHIAAPPVIYEGSAKRNISCSAKTHLLHVSLLVPTFHGQKHSPNWLVTEAVERDALKLLNDSDWAHTVKAGLQDRPCTYQNTLILVPTSQVKRMSHPSG